MKAVERPKPEDVVVQSIAAALTGAVAATATPVADGLAPFILPAFTLALQLDKATWAKRAAKAAEAVQVAASELGVEDSELLDLIAEDPAREELASRVLAAAGQTVNLTVRISALGKALAAGMADSDKLDEAVFVVEALSHLEVPHARVLEHIAAERTCSADDLLTEFPRLKTGLSAIVSTMVRDGLLLERWNFEEPESSTRGDGGDLFTKKGAWVEPNPDGPEHSMGTIKWFPSGKRPPRRAERSLSISHLGFVVLNLLGSEIEPPNYQ